MQTIADRARIPGRKILNANVAKLVCDWLMDAKRKWILVLDNADDDQVLYESSEPSQPGKMVQPFLASLSPTPNGTIIMTTRSKNVASKFVDDCDLLQIDPMVETQAIALIKTKLGHVAKGNDDKIVSELAEVLEFMPLAIVQASAFIKQQSPRSSVAQYLEDFRKSDTKRIKLLQYEAGHPHRDWEAKNSILVTWQLSFDQIQEHHAPAANLLSLMSFFNPHGIPENVLDAQYAQEELEEPIKLPDRSILGRARSYYTSVSGSLSARVFGPSTSAESIALGLEDDVSTGIHDDHDSTSGNEDENDDLRDAIAVLRDFSFVSVGQDPTHLEMHGIVQLATRNWLQAHGESEKWKNKFVNCLSEAFPAGDDQIEGSDECRDLLPHVQSALMYRPVLEKGLRTWGMLLYNAATHLTRRGNWVMMHQLAQKSLKARMKVLGREHLETISTAELTAISHLVLNRHQDASELIDVVLEGRKKLLGIEHQLTIFSMQVRVQLYLEKSQFPQAETLCSNIVDICQNAYGSEDPITLTAMENLGYCLLTQDRLDDAEPLLTKVFETRKALLGCDHPCTIASARHLTSTYIAQNRMQDLEKIGMEALRAHQKLLGPGHVGTVHFMFDMLINYEILDKPSDAEPLWENILMNCHKSPESVPHTLAKTNLSLSALAARASGLADLEVLLSPIVEARKDYARPLQGWLRKFVEKSQTSAKGAKIIEIVQWLYEQQRSHDPEHPATYMYGNALAFVRIMKSDFPDPEDHDQDTVLARQVWEGMKKSFGPKHPETLLAMRELVATLFLHLRIKECLVVCSEALDIHKECFGDDNNYIRQLVETREECLDFEMHEAYMGQPLDMERWLARGFDVNRRSFMYGRSSLSQAAEYGRTEMMSFLLNKGVDPNLRDVNGSEADQDNTDKTPLMWAAVRGNIDACLLLLEHNADVNHEDKIGRSALSWSAEHGRPHVVKLLLEHGAEVDHRDRFRGQTPLSWAAAHGRIMVAKLLLDHGADANISDQQNRHALSWAAEGGNVDIVRLLLNQKNVHIDQQGAAGRTPLAWAVAKSNTAIVKLLLENGADRFIKDRNGISPSSMAAGSSETAIVDLIRGT